MGKFKGGPNAPKFVATTCEGCGEQFPSKNAMFRHLRETNGACLSGEARENYLQYLAEDHGGRRVKSLVLYGYMISNENSNRSGEDVARELFDVLVPKNDEKYQRSYGCIAGTEQDKALEQDAGTGAITEIMCTKLPPLIGLTVDDWVKEINNTISSKGKHHFHRNSIRILSRMDLSFRKFHATHDVTHRRVDCLIPLDFFFFANKELSPRTGIEEKKAREMFFDRMMNFKEGDLDSDTKMFWCTLKRQMQLFTCKVVELDPTDQGAVLEKSFHNKKRKRNAKKRKKDKTVAVDIDDQDRRSDEIKNSVDPKSADEEESGNVAESKPKHVLRRKRFHNFTPRVMAHEYLSYRRLDRFFHRTTVRVSDRPFVVLSLSGDQFLTGQVLRIVGVFLAMIQGLIPEEFIECVFDEHYPTLIPTPGIPPFCVVAGEAAYMTWEGKTKAILSPRRSKLYNKGFCSESLLDSISKWESEVYTAISQEWLKAGVDADGRMAAERKFTKEVLEPWAVGAREELERYRRWKAGNDYDATIVSEQTKMRPLESFDKSIPSLFEKTLHYLRQADSSGVWPSTTPKRQMVMVSTMKDDAKMEDKLPTTLSVAHLKAKSNKLTKSSAYSFLEGQGGASGSFSVGAMPGEKCIQPKANELFPDLMRAAFELEMALFPNREPSSTIAINRNAQFRPHTDSGAGAGQSTSLIVGLGDYVGGELMVEGAKHDIRYKPMEFNGWKQRHWTLPFEGERFSLVWFTPRGCEGVRGIDLCTQNKDE